MSKNPWMKFYPADWRADPALKICSLAARGLWVEMLSIMHEAEPRGHLVIKGRPVTPPMLAALVGVSADEIVPLIGELEDAGVFDRRKSGVIVSRRMEKDENLSRKNRANGEKGGNPNLCNKTEKTESVNRGDKAKKLEARSQKPEDNTHTSLRSVCEPDPPDEIEKMVSAWNALAKQLSLPQVQRITGTRRSKARQRLSEAGGLAGWEAALGKVSASSFLRGDGERSNGHENWVCSFDFLLRQDRFTKLMEGGYDDRLGAQSNIRDRAHAIYEAGG